MSEHPERKEIIKKHSAAIHIQNNISLLQRRAWNVLLYHAYDELPRHERHHVPVKVLIAQLEFDSKNEDYLREALEALVGCKVKWNVLDKDGEWEWGVTTLLAEAKIKGGVCTYAYGPTLRERLYSPTMYAKIDLSIQNQFDSKHAQALWEICVDYLHEARGAGETPFIQLATYRELMGIHEMQYPRFKEFNRRVIKDPVAEINRITDFHVEVEYKRESRKVVAIKFKMQRELELPHYDTKQSTLFPDLDDMPVSVKVLKDAGLSAHEAWEIWQQGFNGVDVDKRPVNISDDPEAVFTQYVREKVHLLKRRKEQGKVKNATGFLLKAIRQNYGNPEFAEEQKTSELRKKNQGHLGRKKELEDTRRGMEAEYNQKQYALCEQIARDEPERLETIMEALTEASSFNRSQYDISKTPLQNYLATQGLRSLVDECLMRDCADRFDALHQEHQDRLSSLNAEIEKVKALC
jgi:hypothetical protein